VPWWAWLLLGAGAWLAISGAALPLWHRFIRGSDGDDDNGSDDDTPAYRRAA
jgi:hypothetical protein